MRRSRTRLVTFIAAAGLIISIVGITNPAGAPTGQPGHPYQHTMIIDQNGRSPRVQDPHLDDLVSGRQPGSGQPHPTLRPVLSTRPTPTESSATPIPDPSGNDIPDQPTPIPTCSPGHGRQLPIKHEMPVKAKQRTILKGWACSTE
jgi:hypothetical protein